MTKVKDVIKFGKKMEERTKMVGSNFIKYILICQKCTLELEWPCDDIKGELARKSNKRMGTKRNGMAIKWWYMEFKGEILIEMSWEAILVLSTEKGKTKRAMHRGIRVILFIPNHGAPRDRGNGPILVCGMFGKKLGGGLAGELGAREFARALREAVLANLLTSHIHFFGRSFNSISSIYDFLPF
jgi:hypothetical protein